MGTNNAKILSPYYDKYFGPSYFQKIDCIFNNEEIHQSSCLPQPNNIQQFFFQPELLIKSEQKVLNYNYNLNGHTKF